MNVVKNIVEFLKKEDGPTAVEYAVMLAAHHRCLHRGGHHTG